MLETILVYLQNFYSTVERLQVTPGYLLGLALIFAIAGLLAMREAAAWFFKVDDVKNDLAKLQETASALEAELRVVRDLLAQANPAAKIGQTEPALVTQAANETSDLSRSSFPISH